MSRGNLHSNNLLQFEAFDVFGNRRAQASPLTMPPVSREAPMGMPKIPKNAPLAHTPDLVADWLDFTPATGGRHIRDHGQASGSSGRILARAALLLRPRSLYPHASLGCHQPRTGRLPLPMPLRLPVGQSPRLPNRIPSALPSRTNQLVWLHIFPEKPHAWQTRIGRGASSHLSTPAPCVGALLASGL